MSVAWLWNPPEGWWTMMRVCGGQPVDGVT